jgi:hypothetical protein
MNSLFQLIKTSKTKKPNKIFAFKPSEYLSILVGSCAFVLILDYFEFFEHHWSWKNIILYFFSLFPFVLGYIILCTAIHEYIVSNLIKIYKFIITTLKKTKIK